MSDFPELLDITDEQRENLDLMQEIIQYRFNSESLLLAAITHPSAT